MALKTVCKKTYTHECTHGRVRIRERQRITGFNSLFFSACEPRNGVRVTGREHGFSDTFFGTLFPPENGRRQHGAR